MEKNLYKDLEAPEIEKRFLKNEIIEKENYLNNQKLKIAEEIKQTLGRDIMSNNIVEEKKKNKIKDFFKKLINTCK